MAKHFISENNSDGKAIFSQIVPEDHNQIETPFGTISQIYATSSVPANVNDSEDLKLTKTTRENGIPDGGVTISNGLAGAIVTLKPGASSPQHRTQSLDIGVVLEGEVEWELDNGEKRVLKVGDTMTQRGTSHKWKNVTPNNGWVKMFFVGVDAAPIKAGGKELAPSWDL